MIDRNHTAAAPEAIGPYSQAVIADGLLYTSGQIDSLSTKYKKVRVNEKFKYLGESFGLHDREEIRKTTGITTPTLIHFGGFFGLAERDDQTGDILENTTMTLGSPCRF